MQKWKLSGFADEISEKTDMQFSTLNKLGMSYVELRGIDGKNISKLNEDELLSLKEKLLRYGIRVSSIGSPIGKVKITEPFEEHFNLFKHVVHIAKTLDALYIRMFSFYHDGEEWTDEEEKEVYWRLEQLIAYAKEEGVVLLHENEKDIYGDTLERCLTLMERLHCENFRAVFDPANFVQVGQKPAEAFQKLKPYVGYMHIKDSEMESQKVVPAGCGDGDIPSIVHELLADGYEGFFSLEPHLGNFAGLAELELGNIMDDLPESGEGTFTVAYNAFMNIIQGRK